MAKKDSDQQKPSRIEKKKQKLEKKEAKIREKEDKRIAKLVAKGVDPADIPEAEDTIGGKIAVFIVTLIIIAIWIAILVLLIKWDIGGFGSTVLKPILKDVPYINLILPEDEEDYSASIDVVDEEYPYSSIEDAINRIKELEIQVEDLKEESMEKDDRLSKLSSVERELEEYKAKEAEFEELKQKFNEEVVFSDKAPDINEYKTYYESIEPANAEVIYKQVVKQLEADEELKTYAETYAAMKPKEAAAVFEKMTDNLSLVAKILETMDTDSRAKILNNIDKDVAARLTKIMDPDKL